MTTECVTVEQEGRIVIATLSQPESRNPLDDNTVSALVDTIDNVNRDPGVSCMILTGSGRAFSAGGNVKEMRSGTGMFGGSPADMRHSYRHGIQRLPRAMWELEVPSIAAVNGPAVGAGCDLAMMCDIRIAAPRASFSESFLRVGLISGDGGAWFLPRVVGLTRAYQMAFTGDPIDAETAERWGCVAEVVADDMLLSRALAMAGKIVGQPPQALRMMKRLIRDGSVGTLEQNLEMAAAMQPLAQHTADHKEALSALFEGREPNFSGR